MTVIVGILCDGGVAIASDRKATNVAFLPLVEPQPVQISTQALTKIALIGTDTILATSGSPPIGDEYETIIKRYQKNFSGRSYELATKKLKDEIRANVNRHWETADLINKAISMAHAYTLGTCECLLGANFKDGIRLVQILTEGTFDIATKDMPVRVIGTGQMQADPFLVFLRNIFWPDRLPTVDEGVLYAIWAVEYASEVGAPNVGSGINAFSITKYGNRVSAKEVTEVQIKENQDFIREAKDQLRKIADVRHATPADAKKIPTIRK